MSQAIELSDLVQPGRVHRRIYTDPAIFQREMERIFERAWLYVGHESQVREAGDFFTARVGRKKIIVSRHTDGLLYALHNRCSHRGSEVCPEPRGRTKRFVCPYHAWSFNNKGELLGVPHASGYGEGFRERKSELGLEPVARIDNYRGFIFASLAVSGPTLEEYLGRVVCEAFDNFVDRSPEGEIELVEGKLIQTFRANWKLQIENSIDLVHPPVLHLNAVQVSADFMREAPAGRPVPAAIEIFRSNGLPYQQWDQVGQFALDRGHCYMEGFFPKSDDPTLDEDARFGSDDQMRFSTQADYKAALIARHGRDKTEQILGFHRHNTIIYPNLFINPRIQQLRVLYPVAADRTEQHCHVFRLKGAPEEALHVAVAFLTASNSPSSIATTDDHEVFERIQHGLQYGETQWLDLSRGLGLESATGQGLRAVGTSELAMRNQHKAWAELMAGERL
jgi:benzoate/toluate 1,2-dioxygenase subunit alpha